jgi:bifunctional enzyme CysN/CysC
MVTGASTADVAVILVDARKGVVTQTRRHSYVLALVGVRRVVLAVNKMDLVDYAESPFRAIESEYQAFAEALGIGEVTAIPVSALLGDNITRPSRRTQWYHGATLIGYLETAALDEERTRRLSFRLPVQSVNRPDSEFRGFAGTIAAGTVHPGDAVRVQPSGLQTTVARIVTFDGDLERAVAGQSVTLTLMDEVDVSRGDLLSAAAAPAEVADQFETTIIWMDEAPLLPGRPYQVKIGAKTVPATVTHIKYRINVDTTEHVAATKLEMNEIGVCNVAVDQELPFDPYAVNHTTGGFILVDPITNATSGAGMIHFALRRAHNIQRQLLTIDKARRAASMRQRPCVIWFTGVSGAGKSTIANLVETNLQELGYRTYLLDGDNVRQGLNKDLGFTDADRVENIRRVGEVAKLMVDAALIVLVSFISPFRSERRMARHLLDDSEFIEVYVNTPLAVAEQRDTKGLYKKARLGELKNFTGVDSPYEPPERPELEILTTSCTPEVAASKVIQRLRDLDVLDGRH